MISNLGHPGPSLVSPYSCEFSLCLVLSDFPRQHCEGWSHRLPQSHFLDGRKWWDVPGSWHLSRASLWSCVCNDPVLPERAPGIWDLGPWPHPGITIYWVQGSQGKEALYSTCSLLSLFLSSENGFLNLQQCFHYGSSFPQCSISFWKCISTDQTQCTPVPNLPMIQFVNKRIIMWDDGC